MGRVLAISSQVAHGAVGLSAAVPALQALGHEVIALPTILLSNHPGHPRFAGERVTPALLDRMLDALDFNGWLAGLDAILTGYLPSAEHAAFTEATVRRVKQLSPGALYVCDPVLGDHPKGLYIAQDAAEAIRSRLVPQADVVKMNRFEAEWLSGTSIANSAHASVAVRRHHWRTVMITSLPATETATLTNVLITSDALPLSIDVARHDRVPNGTGDLFGALWVGHRLRGQSETGAFERTIEDVALVISRSLHSDELQLASALKDLKP
jgi:pyridoxine kinase